MTDVKKTNQITPTENKNGADDMSRKVSFKRKSQKFEMTEGQNGRFSAIKRTVHLIFNKKWSYGKISGH